MFKFEGVEDAGLSGLKASGGPAAGGDDRARAWAFRGKRADWSRAFAPVTLLEISGRVWCGRRPTPADAERVGLEGASWGAMGAWGAMSCPTRAPHAGRAMRRAASAASMQLAPSSSRARVQVQETPCTLKSPS